jgi:sugar (pentulose or hexulose) kinase
VFDTPVRVLVETESAALGAALQACWSVRRRDDGRLTCHEVAAPFVQIGATTAPNGDAGSYAELLQRYRREVARLYS